MSEQNQRNHSTESCSRSWGNYLTNKYKLPFPEPSSSLGSWHFSPTPRTSALPMKQAEGDMINGTPKNHQGTPHSRYRSFNTRDICECLPSAGCNKPSRAEHALKHSNIIFPKYHAKRLLQTELLLFKSLPYFSSC